VLLGALSPSGSHLITVSGSEDPSGGGDWELCVREMGSNGNVLNNIPFIRKGRPPSKIAFISDNQFYTEELDVTPKTWSFLGTTMSKVRHTSTRVRKAVAQRLDEIITSTANSEGRLRSGVHHKEYYIRKTFSLEIIQTPRYGTEIDIGEVLGEEIIPTCPYSLDESLEWVLDTESRRVCWLPPGYVTRIEGGHFFVDSSIVTAGQDGIVRKLTFIEPRPDS